MKIQIIQNEIGQFNFIGNERSLKFSLAIKDEENKTIEEGKNRAIIKLSVNEDLEDLEDLEYDLAENFNKGNIGYIFNRCFKYAEGVCSNEDYKGNTILFWKIYTKNKKELEKQFIEIENKKIKDEIECLNRKLDNLKDFEFYDYGYDEYINELKTRLQRWLITDKEELQQFKKDTELYKDKEKTIEDRKNRIEELNILIK